jgi:hypothetical protein
VRLLNLSGCANQYTLQANKAASNSAGGDTSHKWSPITELQTTVKRSRYATTSGTTSAVGTMNTNFSIETNKRQVIEQKLVAKEIFWASQNIPASLDYPSRRRCPFKPFRRSYQLRIRNIPSLPSSTSANQRARRVTFSGHCGVTILTEQECLYHPRGRQNLALSHQHTRQDASSVTTHQ